MEEKKDADIEKSLPAEDKKEPLQDVIDKDLEEIKKKTEGKTRREKLLYTKRRIEDQLRELGEPIEEEDDNTPVTVGYLKKIKADEAAKTALQLANEIEDDKERELTIHHLKNSVKSQGNPTEDLRLARAIVNSRKNAEIAEEASRRTSAKTHSSASSAPANKEEEDIELTQEEKVLMAFSPTMTIADIKKARGK